MRRNKGIVIANRPGAQSARIEGTGIEVVEILKVYRAVGEDWEALRESFDWLSEEQLRAALAYADEHRLEMDERLKVEDDAPRRVEELWRTYPALAPKRQ